MAEPVDAMTAIAAVAMHRDPYAYPKAYKAMVHPDEVDNYSAGGWMLGEGFDPSDPAIMPRDLLIAELGRRFAEHLETCSDDDLRVTLQRLMDPPERVEQPSEPEPAVDESGSGPIEPASTDDVGAPAKVLPFEVVAEPGVTMIFGSASEDTGFPVLQVVTDAAAGDPEPAPEINPDPEPEPAPEFSPTPEAVAPAPGDRDGDGLAREDMTKDELRAAITAGGGTFQARASKEDLQRNLAGLLLTQEPGA